MGILSLLLLLVSIASIVLVTQQANAMTAHASVNNSGQILPFDNVTGTTVFTATSIPSPTSTDTPSPTPTDTPSPTPTDTPTPTPTDTPSPTPTDTPTLTPTTAPSPTATNPPSSSPTARPTAPAGPTAPANGHVTPGATVPAQPTSTVSTSQGSGGQVSTPTDTSTVTSASTDNNYNDPSQNAQTAASHLMEIVAGILCTGMFLFLLFLGWRQLRKHVLLTQPANLPPSGAAPWSRDRAISSVFSSWDQVNNYQQVELSNTAIAANQEPITLVNADPNVFAHSGYAPGGSDFPPPINSFQPTIESFQPVTNQDYPPATDQFASMPYAIHPENAVHFQDATLVPPMSDLNNNYDAQPVALPWSNAQLAPGAPSQPPDFSDPYLKEMIRHYSEKGRDGSAPNDFPWSSSSHE
ncbi:MAG TPA: hypothetical protein VJ761_22045 [Ktedonobacteraceae bacterium]|nr:hypothetical protein [Ktedonobacteraceae bacterium]